MATAAVQTLDISPVGRVEGDLDVRVDIENGVVTNAWTQAELFRGFEIILRDKDPQAGLVVTPRACGICGASHLTCAAWALDTAWKTEVPRNAILARNLGQIVESLQSLPRHHYGLFMIDYTHKNYSKSPFYQEAVKRWAPFTGTNYELGVTISGRPVEIYALLGGQWPHSSYMVPGGVMCAPTLTDVTRAWSILEHFRRNWMEPVWLGCSLERYEEIKSYDDLMAWLDERPEHANSDLGLYLRMSKDIGLDKYGAGLGKYVSWGYLPNEDKYQKPTIEGRNAAVWMKSGVYDGKTDSPRPWIRPLPARMCSMPGTTSRADCIPSTAPPSRCRRTPSTLTANIPGRPPCATPRTAALRPVRWRARWWPAARMAKTGSITIRWCSTCTSGSAAPV